jgi:acetolactate synthase I/II/III large subunit
MLPAMTAGAPRHDLITLTGGAIGQGLPNAVGAAIACPDRPVHGPDRRRHAPCTPFRRCGPWRARTWTSPAIIFNNASYSVLNIELERVGAERIGPKARSQLDLSDPALDFARMAQGMGVHAVSADTPKISARRWNTRCPCPART